MRYAKTRNKLLSDAFDSDFDQLILATPEHSDPQLDPTLTDILRLVREHLEMDVVFVSQHLGEHHLFQRIEADAPVQALQGSSQVAADSYCARVLDGRLPPVMPDVPALRDTHDVPESPVQIGAFMAVPVHLSDGSLYGTLCCFNFEPRASLGEREYKRLQMSARLTARLIDESQGRATLPTA